MTDASAHLPTLAAARPVTMSWRATLLVAVVAAAGAAWLATTPAAVAQATQSADGELVMLLRFMAAVKASMALAALAVTFWRLGYPASPLLSLAYVGSVALMCAAPVLIWQLADVAIGAALFHAGLGLLVVALFADRGQAPALAKATLARRRRV
jgi:hypothetical protein